MPPKKNNNQSASVSGGGGGAAAVLGSSIGHTTPGSTFLTDIKRATELQFIAGYEDDAGRALGMETEALKYENAMLALTNPVLYAEKRLEEYELVKDAVNAEYAAVFSEMSQMGQSRDVSERNALAAADRVRQMKMASFHLLYPETANAISQSEMSRRSAANNFAGAPANIGGYARRVAPRKRATRKKK